MKLYFSVNVMKDWVAVDATVQHIRSYRCRIQVVDSSNLNLGETAKHIVALDLCFRSMDLIARGMGC